MIFYHTPGESWTERSKYNDENSKTRDSDISGLSSFHSDWELQIVNLMSADFRREVGLISSNIPTAKNGCYRNTRTLYCSEILLIICPKHFTITTSSKQS